MSLEDLDGTEEGDCNLKNRKGETLALHPHVHNYKMRANLSSNSPGEATGEEPWKGKERC